MAKPFRTYEGLVTDPIDVNEARFLASIWHGGQRSALYAFSSSGYLDNVRALTEAYACMSSLDVGASLDDEYELMQLIDYLERITPYGE